MKPKVFIRADGNSTIGHGHVIRCLALAEMIRDHFDITFIIQSPSEALKKNILSTCNNIIELPVIDVLTEEINDFKFIVNRGDIIVLDGYHFTSNYHERLFELGSKIVCIDDLAGNYLFANAIINHSGGFSPQMYSANINTRFYLGPEYSLLRKPFIEASKQQKVKVKDGSLFINMGGADPENHTLVAIKKSFASGLFKKFSIVLGSSYKHFDSIEEFKSNKDINFYTNLSAEEMSNLMKHSETAICSSSTIAYEYCSIGGILFIVKTADNQKYLFDYLISQKLAFEFNRLGEILPEEVQQQFSIQSKVFDGKVGERFKRIFNNLITEDKLKVRRAEKNDMLRLFEWANDQETRSNSINKEPIALESHQEWFYKKLEDEKTCFFIISLGEEEIGQVRLDNKGEFWLISFSVDKNYRRHGLGEIILSESIKEFVKGFNNQVLFKAQVMDSNKGSEKIFLKLGFEQRGFEIIQNEKFVNFYKVLN